MYYGTPHSSGKARGGSEIYIKNDIKHAQTSSYQTDKIQATTINITLHNRDVNISAIYCPLKHAISAQEFNKFFRSYKTKFIALGDLNAKHNY